MPTDAQTLKNELKQKDKEIKELKQLLAEAEAELKEYSSADNLVRPRASILESTSLNKAIKGTFFILLCAIIVTAGLYPWFFKDKILGGGEPAASDAPAAVTLDTMNTAGEASSTTPVANEPTAPMAETPADRDIFAPAKKQTVEVASDLGWLNVRTEPSVETGKVITRINSGQAYEWLEKTEDNWYKLVIDEQGHTGYASGEYLVE